MVSFCVKIRGKHIDSDALWKRVGRDNINLLDINHSLWVHGTVSKEEFLNVVDECLEFGPLSIEVRG
jgi:hypothetical protein